MRAPIRVAAVSAVGIVTLAACVANPGPPPVVEHSAETPSSSTTTTTTTTPPPADDNADEERSTVAIGVDPLSSGLNPHLRANNSELVHGIADLVLPSAFHGGQMDTDVLDSAAEVPAPDGVAQRVRFVISDAAQWSDGTPITGADFEYLWRSMVDTPDAVGASGYRAIKDVRTSKGGRIVTVDFDHYVTDWRILFTHLLPSHLVKDEDFSSVLAQGIPASAGAFLVDSVDRGRGVITLNRNDRFWGENPAKVDVVQLRFIRSSAQAVDMVRSGQIEAADLTPGETTVESLELIPDIDTHVVQRPRQLRLHMGEQLGDVEERRDLASLVDTEQLARLATGRSNHLEPARGGKAVIGERDLRALRERAELRPVRIAADPSDAVANAAAHTLADVLAQHDIAATVEEERLSTITSRLNPAGAVDAYFAWDDTFATSFSVGDDVVCALDHDTDSEPCPAETPEYVWDVLAGAVPAEEAAERVARFAEAAAVRVPILNETRLRVGDLDVRGVAGWEGAEK